MGSVQLIAVGMLMGAFVAGWMVGYVVGRVKEAARRAALAAARVKEEVVVGTPDIRIRKTVGKMEAGEVGWVGMGASVSVEGGVWLNPRRVIYGAEGCASPDKVECLGEGRYRVTLVREEDTDEKYRRISYIRAEEVVWE